MKKRFVVILIFLSILLIANLIWLDLQIINLGVKQETINNSISKPDNLLNIIPDTDSSRSGLTSEDFSLITSYIKEATASMSKEIIDLKQNQKFNSFSKTDNINTVKEYYLPLGTGSTSGADWTDISGAESSLVPSNYGKIKEMYFEASVRLPTGDGRVYARLKNVTDNVGLIESEIFRDGTQTGLVSSVKIPVPNTTKLYRVQMKSTSGALSVLDSARIKIFVE